MITSAEIQLLQGLTEAPPKAVKLDACVLLYARWFALEVPHTLIGGVSFDDSAPDEAKDWRKLVPEGEGSYGQAFRTTNPDDNVPLVKLVGDCGVARIHPSIYDVVLKTFTEPQFFVFPGKHSFVAIKSSGNVIGCVAQIKV